MYNAKLKSAASSYTLGWKDKNYSFSGGVVIVVPDEVKDYLESMAIDIKGNCLFTFTRVKDEAAVTPEITEEVSALEDIFEEETPKSGKKSIKKVDNK